MNAIVHAEPGPDELSRAWRVPEAVTWRYARWEPAWVREECRGEAAVAVAEAVRDYLPGRGGLYTVAYTYAKYAVWNLLKSRRRRARLLGQRRGLHLAECRPDPGQPDPAEVAESRDAAGQAQAAVARLKPRLRRVLEMAAEGLTRVEIGEALKVSKQRAHQLVEVARKQTLELMEG